MPRAARRRSAPRDRQPRHAAAERFAALTRRNHHAQVLEGIAAVPRAGFSGTKLDTVVIRGVNDDELADLIEFGRRVPAEVRFIEVHGRRRRHALVGRAGREPHGDAGRAGAALRWDRARGRDVVGAGRSVPAAGRHRLRHHRLHDGAVLRGVRPQPAHRDGLWYLCLYAMRGIDLRGPLRGGASSAQLKALITGGWTARTDRGARTAWRWASGRRSCRSAASSATRTSRCTRGRLRVSAGVGQPGGEQVKADVRERGAGGQHADRRLFMQLQVLGGCADPKPLVTTLETSRLEAVLYQDVNDPRGVGVLAMSEDPTALVGAYRDLLNTEPFAGLSLRRELTMLGRTYAAGFEQDLEEWLFLRPRRTVLNSAWPWAIWYPLRRHGGVRAPLAEEQGEIIPRATRSSAARTATPTSPTMSRLACHGLDVHDTTFVIGLHRPRAPPAVAPGADDAQDAQTRSISRRLGPSSSGTCAAERPRRVSAGLEHDDGRRARSRGWPWRCCFAPLLSPAPPSRLKGRPITSTGRRAGRRAR